MPTERENLEPIDPRIAQQLYLDHKRTECTESTVRNHKYHTNYLVEWCEQNGVDNLNEVTGRNLQEIRLWRKEVDDINLLTLNNHMSTLWVFLKWAASIEAVPENLYDKVMVPKVAPEDEQADETLDADYEAIDEVLALTDVTVRVSDEVDVADGGASNQQATL